MRVPTHPSNVFQILQELQSHQQVDNWSESPVQFISFRTTTSSKSASELMMTATSTQGNISSMTTQAFPVRSQSGPSAPSAHVHKPPTQALKPGDSVALRKVQTPLNCRTSVMRNPLTKQEILSHYASCFKGIGQFPGEPYKFHLKPEHRPAIHAPRKVQVHLDEAFKKEINSLVELGILDLLLNTQTG